MTGGRYRGGGAQKGIQVRGSSVIWNFPKLKSEAKAVSLGVEPIRPPVVVLGGEVRRVPSTATVRRAQSHGSPDRWGEVVVPSIWWEGGSNGLPDARGSEGTSEFSKLWHYKL